MSGIAPEAADDLRSRPFDALVPGECASITRAVRPEDIALFAAGSGDLNPAHLDPAFAARTLFGLLGIGLNAE